MKLAKRLDNYHKRTTREMTKETIAAAITVVYQLFRANHAMRSTNNIPGEVKWVSEPARRQFRIPDKGANRHEGDRHQRVKLNAA